ncbi:MAG: SDR family NAD(P)-dependent oxidoreductase [Nitrosarchaeum sp.]|nr:SDR family NAD(P)-dependent oxidoreductase [Nitrosarchaeum sp.]MCA9819705.1 SDR family NAD(P)-dependent oxidoreductase [Nitrosarchaeum sp.]
MFEGKKILITGGTGSLGRALTKRLLKYDVDTIRVFSRNESKQVEMEDEIRDERLRFFIGDIRDEARLARALEDVNIVFHAAALKHVPVVEYNPFEAVKTNVMGTQNLIDACISQKVEIAVGVGTDKAVSPLNAYGATKLLMEKLFVTASNYLNKNKYKTKFIALRYGNVLGSSGSVVPRFINQIKAGEKMTITNPSMTRCSITMDEALNFILKSTNTGHGSDIFVPKLKAYSIGELKDALVELLGDPGQEDIPIRPGEKIHEVLINSDEMRTAWETDSDYVIVDANLTDEKVKSMYPGFAKVTTDQQYSSDKVEMISKEELKKAILDSGLV